MMLRGAVARIHDIANELLLHNRSNTNLQNSKKLFESDVIPTLLSSLLEGLITEKRMLYRSTLGIEIEYSVDSNCHSVFAAVQASEFKRVLSNLIDNSVEAISFTSLLKVEVRLELGPRGVCIFVRDNGRGILPEILGKLTQRGETYGKVGGSGLGLFHARKTIEAWGGNFIITSSVGQGTVIHIALPQCPPPVWFADLLSLKVKMKVLVLDDDPSIHRIWKGRWETMGLHDKGFQIEHFSMPDQLRMWHSQEYSQADSVLCLFDHELIGFKESGLDLIEELGLGNQSVLVTSRFEEILIRKRCSQLGVKLLPKGLAGFVRIEVAESMGCPDLVLVDDDPLVHLSWKLTALQNGRNLKSYSNASSFLSEAVTLDKNIPIYIDESLGSGVSGLAIARNLHQRGFRRLFLATGYMPSHFGEQPWLEGIVGKEPPNWKKVTSRL